MKKHYRVIIDDYAGFEAQERILFTWWQLPNDYGLRCNTFTTKEEAIEFIKKYHEKKNKPRKTVY